MRNLFLAAAALAAIAAPAGAATRSFGITSFTKVRIEGPYKVTLATGVAPFARASGSATALDRIAIEVRDDTLVVNTNPSAWGGYPGEQVGPVEISLGTHDLTNVSLTGAGSVAIDRVKGLTFSLSAQGAVAAQIGDVAADELRLNLAGAASAKVGGHALKLTALVRGLSLLDAAKLSTRDAHVTADGSATVDAVATDTARVDAWGPATIRFAGRPACTLKVTGSTSVSGCK